MILCKADFEELFPARFDAGPGLAQQTRTIRSLDVSIARWEDDGGRIPTRSAAGSSPPPTRASQAWVPNGLVSPWPSFLRSWLLISTQK